MAASDAVGDLVTLSQAFGQFSGSLLSLFDAKISAETNRIAVDISNRQTNFLMDFDRAPDDPQAINTKNWQQRLSEYDAKIQGDIDTIREGPVKNAVAASLAASQNKFKLQVADKMGQKMIMETRDDYAASLFSVRNGAGSASLRANMYKTLLDGIPEGYFSETEKAAFELDYRQLQAQGWDETNLASASDPTLPFEEASKKGVAVAEATQDQKAFMQTDIKGRSDAADKAADNVLKAMSDQIKGGSLSYESAMNQLKRTTSSASWRDAAEAKVGLLVDEEIERQVIGFVTAWQSVNPQNAKSADIASSYRQAAMALGPGHTVDGMLRIQAQIEKIKVMSEDDVTEAEKRRAALTLYGQYLDAYRAGPAGNMTGRKLVAAVTALRPDIPDIVNKFQEDFAVGKIQDLDGYIGAFLDVSTNKTLLTNISGALGTKTKLGTAFAKVVTAKDKAKGTLENVMVSECLMTIADVVKAQNSQGLKMKQSEINDLAIKSAIKMASASEYWDMAIKPGEGNIKDLERQMYNFIKIGDAKTLEPIYARDQYYNRPDILPFTQAQTNISLLIQKKGQELMDSGAPELKGYDWSQLKPGMIGAEMYLFTDDGLYAFGLDAGEKKDTVVLKRYNVNYGSDTRPSASYDDTVVGGKAINPPPAPPKPKPPEPRVTYDSPTMEKRRTMALDTIIRASNVTEDFVKKANEAIAAGDVSEQDVLNIPYMSTQSMNAFRKARGIK